MQRKTLSLIIFLATIIAITIPLAILTSGAGTDTFSANVTVQNNVPTITWVEAAGDSPQAGDTKIIQIDFNVSDNNTVTDIVTASSHMNITRSGETARLSSACFSVSNSSDNLEQSITCNITIYWYDEAGAWNISVYATDGTGSDSDSTTADFTMGTTDDINVIETALTFTGNPGQANVASSDNPLVINNTGNQPYTSINITGYNLTGGGDTIGATDFAVNISNSGGPGDALAHNAPIVITGSSLTRGASATEDLYFWVDIPSGIVDTDYNTGGNPWTIDPIV